MRAKKNMVLGAVLFSAILAGCNGTEKTTKDSLPEGAKLDFSESSGIYQDEFNLKISCDGASAIYYTTDGSDPTTSKTRIEYQDSVKIKDRSGDKNVVSAVSPSLFCTNFGVYDEGSGFECYLGAPLDSAVDKCTVIKAVAEGIKDQYTSVVTQTYFIGTTEDHIQGLSDSCEAAGEDLAVISITMDYDDLFDSEKGIYVKGDIFDQAVTEYLSSNSGVNVEDARKLAANYNQRGSEWEREAHVDFFEFNSEGATNVITQDCGIRIQGNYSRSDVQKSFRLYAKSEYGASKFDYPVFGEDLTSTSGESIDSFDTFVLRAGGNCALTSKFNDTYWQTIVQDLDCDTKASRPCVVYLNGEYWGLYVLEEDYSDDYYEDHYDVAKEDVVAYKGDAESIELGYKLDLGELPEGETNVSYYYQDLLDFFDTHSNLERDEDYQAFAELVDVESVMDYFGAEIWINNKWDWPGKNWSMWRTVTTDSSSEYADGKWRFSFYDMEFGGVSGSADAYANTIKEDNYEPKGLLDMGTDNPAVLCFAYLMTNDDFRAEFSEKMLGFSTGTFEKEHAIEVLTTFENTYGPLFDQFFNRYPGTGSKDEALFGGYASSQCIKFFLTERSDNIQGMLDWAEQIMNQ